MSDVTALQVYDLVREHLLRQGQKSVVPRSDLCAYRSYAHDGSVLKCAVGCLILDEHYDRRIEGVGLCSVIVRDGQWVALDGAAPGAVALARALRASGVPATETVLRLLRRLQDAHDSYQVATWPIVLDRVRAAVEYGSL